MLKNLLQFLIAVVQGPGLDPVTEAEAVIENLIPEAGIAPVQKTVLVTGTTPMIALGPVPDLETVVALVPEIGADLLAATQRASHLLETDLEALLLRIMEMR